MKKADAYREFANRRYVEPARRSGEKFVRIKSGDIVNGLALKNSTPNVCSAIESKIFERLSRVKLIGKRSSAPKGTSTTTEFTFEILDVEGRGEAEPSPRRVTFADLEGIGKEAFAALGGGEAFIRSERENFYGDAPDPGKRR
ncbi:MAG: hypothetical protein WA700_09205 [Acidobacteriaceae bacterium]